MMDRHQQDRVSGYEPRALVVDDQRPLAELLAERLAMDGIHTEIATTAAEALALAGNNHFDIAFVDLKLPDMSGAMAAAHLKRRDPGLKVVLITGYASSVDEAEPFWTHVDGVLPKPWQPAELAAILRTIGRGDR